LKRLEPDEGKLSCPVLRGDWRSNAPPYPTIVKALFAMVIPPFFCFEGTVYDVTNLACGVAHFQAECLAHYSPVRVAHIAPESLAHFTPVEVAHYAPVCSLYRRIFNSNPYKPQIKTHIQGR